MRFAFALAPSGSRSAWLILPKTSGSARPGTYRISSMKYIMVRQCSAAPHYPWVFRDRPKVAQVPDCSRYTFGERSGRAELEVALTGTAIKLRSPCLRDSSVHGQNTHDRKERAAEFLPAAPPRRNDTGYPNDPSTCRYRRTIAGSRSRGRRNDSLLFDIVDPRASACRA